MRERHRRKRHRQILQFFDVLASASGGNEATWTPVIEPIHQPDSAANNNTSGSAVGTAWLVTGNW